MAASKILKTDAMINELWNGALSNALPGRIPTTNCSAPKGLVWRFDELFPVEYQPPSAADIQLAREVLEYSRSPPPPPPPLDPRKVLPPRPFARDVCLCMAIRPRLS